MSVQIYKLLLVTYAFIIQRVNLYLYKIIVKFEVGKHFGRSGCSDTSNDSTFSPHL